MLLLKQTENRDSRLHIRNTRIGFIWGNSNMPRKGNERVVISTLRYSYVQLVKWQLLNHYRANGTNCQPPISEQTLICPRKLSRSDTYVLSSYVGQCVAFRLFNLYVALSRRSGKSTTSTFRDFDNNIFQTPQCPKLLVENTSSSFKRWMPTIKVNRLGQ